MLAIEKHNIILRKLLWGFKYIRFKSSFKPSAGKNIKDVMNQRSCELAQILDCTNHTAQNIISRNKAILTLDCDSFVRNAKFCNEHLKLSDIVEFPCLISLNSSLLQHRYFSLWELGCSNITASNILKYLQLIKKTPKMLESDGVYISCEKNIDYCMDLLSDSSCEMKPEIKYRFQNMYKNGSTLKKIKEAMNAEILSSHLNCCITKTHVMFHRYPPLRIQSIGNTLKVLNVLVQKHNFPISKVIYTPTLFAIHHEVLDDFFENVPDILGVNTMKLVEKMPLLLKRSASSMHQVERILQEYNISREQLLSCPKVITFSNCTLQERLKSLCKSEVFQLLKSHKKFLWLVYYYNRLSPRLEVLQSANIPYSITMFTISDSKFDNYLCYDGWKSSVQDISHYLAQTLDCDEKTIIEKLHGHPNSETFSLTNCSKVVEFLLNSGVTKKQLLNGLDIIVYDIDIVTVYFNNLSNHPRCQPFSEWSSHYNLIQLLIYVIEVDNGFRGSRANATEMRCDDSEELSISGFAF